MRVCEGGLHNLEGVASLIELPNLEGLSKASVF
jgi:hypothetical protein